MKERVLLPSFPRCTSTRIYSWDPRISMLRQPCTRERSARRVWRVFLGVDSACVACDVILLCLRPRTFAPRTYVRLSRSHSCVARYYSVLFHQTRSCVRGASHADLHLSRRVPAHACSREISGFQPINAWNASNSHSSFSRPKIDNSFKRSRESIRLGYYIARNDTTFIEIYRKISFDPYTHCIYHIPSCIFRIFT